MEPYYNTSYGNGFSGFLNYSNSYAGNLLAPIFLVVMFAITVTVMIKNTTLKKGAVIAYSGLLWFVVSLFLKTITPFNDFFMFALAICVPVGIIISYLEG